MSGPTLACATSSTTWYTDSDPLLPALPPAPAPAPALPTMLPTTSSSVSNTRSSTHRMSNSLPPFSSFDPSVGRVIPVTARMSDRVEFRQSSKGTRYFLEKRSHLVQSRGCPLHVPLGPSQCP